ncbi:MAG: hypothetical protein DRQ88_08040 [Epsilonproteobacteria bacterium]|nr:MAG: hypothetical protein DRQ89_05625 [Campylobacterota bacterium]RLA66072.1 MAG: hypothetical protein DRQ88_08040 [Campylobacterota bacterium]
MLYKLIIFLVLFSFVGSFASEVGSNCDLETSTQTADKCCDELLLTDVLQSKSNNNEDKNQSPNTDCCESFCLWACDLVINLLKTESKIAQSPQPDNSDQWHYFQHFYKSPFIDPILKPPLFS